MRKLTVDGVAFEWLVGRSHIRIRGNGHVSDVFLMQFLEHLGVPRRQAYEMTEERHPQFGIEPSDVVSFIRSHGWLQPKESKKTKQLGGVTRFTAQGSTRVGPPGSASFEEAKRDLVNFFTKRERGL